MKHIKQVKKGFKAALAIWHLVVVTILSLAFIPLFLTQGRKGVFYTWWILPSIFAYLILTIIQLRLKKGMIKEYLENLATRLFIASIGLAIAFIFVGLQWPVWSNVSLVIAAVLYAAAIQKIFFLRVIGL